MSWCTGEYSVAVVRRLTKPLNFAEKVAVAKFANETVGRQFGRRVGLIMAAVDIDDIWSTLMCGQLKQCFGGGYERHDAHAVLPTPDLAGFQQRGAQIAFYTGPCVTIY